MCMKPHLLGTVGFIAIWLLMAQPCVRMAAGDEVWISIGPRGIRPGNNDVVSGQVNAIAVHPTDATTLYIGASEGGIWKTIDGGASWTPLTDFELVRKLASGEQRGTLSVGSLAIHPSRPETVYVGTGDPNVACCLVGPGLGVFRSPDGGIHWTPLGADLSTAGCQNVAMSQAVVNKIVVLPGTAVTVLFAATDRGLFEYQEGPRDCWTRVADANKHLPEFGHVIDLVKAPGGVLYAAVHGRGIFRTVGADTAKWDQLTSGLPSSGFERIALAIAPANRRILYAGFDAGGSYRLFKTIDGGDTWSTQPSPPNDGQLSFNNALAVGLNNPDFVYIGQVAVWRATDGGTKGGLNNYGEDPRRPLARDRSWVNLSCCLVVANPLRKGLDLHGDVHDIVFAPRGSFSESPSVAEILYVATDGGVTAGVMNDVGVVTWQPLTRGLAIGQCGTIGLAPSNEQVAACGLWHNGNAFTADGGTTWHQFGQGDGFQTTIDAAGPSTGPWIVYFNSNAGDGSAISRAQVKLGSIIPLVKQEVIWSDNTGESGPPASDPYRPGDLLRVGKEPGFVTGKLVRNGTANTTAAPTLDRPSSWDLIDPPSKTGNTVTIAFKRKLGIDDLPVYYVGTDTGQIWHGSPEVGWTRVCDCGASVRRIATDLNNPNRIVAAFAGDTSPGRIKELIHLPSDTWTVSDIDADFKPSLRVDHVAQVVVDPLDSSTVFVGTDQGVYRGRLETGLWRWTRSPGVPNVSVTGLEAHQRFRDIQTGIVRASTYGRGIFELKGTFLP